MTAQERTRSERQQDGKNQISPKKKVEQQANTQIKTPDESAVFIDTSSWTSPGKHADLLVNAHTDGQRFNLVTHLQHSYGNAYVQRLLNSRAVQAKLAVSQPNDPFEREADQMAEAIIGTASAVQTPSQIQRQSPEEEEIQGKATKGQLQIQRQSPEEEEIQGKAAYVQLQVDDELENRIDAVRGSGQNLSAYFHGTSIRE
jgi:hypothetical protein